MTGTTAEILAAAREYLASPDLGPGHSRLCQYIRDHGGRVFAHSPPGNTRNLIQFESTPDGNYSFSSPDPEYRLEGSREAWTQPNDPVFEKLFAETRAVEMDAGNRRERFEKLLPKGSRELAAVLVALADRIRGLGGVE